MTVANLGVPTPPLAVVPAQAGLLLESVVIAMVLLTIAIGIAASLWPARKVAD